MSILPVIKKLYGFEKIKYNSHIYKIYNPPSTISFSQKIIMKHIISKIPNMKKNPQRDIDFDERLKYIIN